MRYLLYTVLAIWAMLHVSGAIVALLLITGLGLWFRLMDDVWGEDFAYRNFTEDEY